MMESLYIPLGGISPNSTGSEASLSAESDSRSEFAHQIRDKVVVSAYRWKAKKIEALSGRKRISGRDSGYARSVAVGADHPDTSHLMQAFDVVNLKVDPLFRQGQSIKITIVRLSEVEDEG
jgi:hypothetical protein